MKKCCCFGLYILFLLFVYSCKNGGANKILVDVDSLLMRDSVNAASVKLMRIKDGQLTKEDHFYYNLLKIQILSRQYRDVSESIIDSCIKYYEENGDRKKLTDAYYYKGGLLYDNGDIANALLYFKRAENEMSDYIPQTEYKICSSLAYGNFASENYILSLKYAKRCERAAKYIRNTERYVFAKYYEYISYAKLGEEDSSDICMKQFIPYISKTKNKEERALYFSEACAYFLRKGDIAEASNFISKALALDRNTTVCGIAAMYYLSIKQYAKAEKLYEESLNKALTLAHKVAAYHGLGNVLTAENEREKASYYYKKEIETMDSLAQKNQDEGAKDIQYDFDADNINKANSRKLSIMSLVCIILCGLLSVTAVVAFVINRRKNIKLRQIGCNLEKSANEIVALQKINGGHSKEMERLKHDMDKSIEVYIKQLSQGRRLYEGLALGRFIEKRDSKAMKSLLAYYRIVDPGFFASLEEEYDNLTVQSQLILMLRHIGKGDDDIASLLGVGDNSIRSYKYRIKKCHKCH